MLTSKLSRLPQRLPMPAPQSGQVLAHHFPFPTGAKTKDYSGSGNDGTISGASYINGKLGQALIFDGINDYIECGNDSSVQILTNITIALWVKASSKGDTGYDALVRKGTGYALSFDNANPGHIRWFGYSSGSPKGIVLAGGSYIYDNQWHFVACTFNGTTWNIYIDGTLDQTKDDACTLDNPAHNLNLGKRSDGTDYFNGSMDEIRIWNRVFSAYEIKLLAANNEYICRGA